jgi:galactokinase
LNIKPVDIALMGQSAEHWVGINCGIMDQFSSVMGLENKVIKLIAKHWNMNIIMLISMIIL